MRLELSPFLYLREIIWEGMELHTWLPSARGLLSSEGKDARVGLIRSKACLCLPLHLPQQGCEVLQVKDECTTTTQPD